MDLNLKINIDIYFLYFYIKNKYFSYMKLNLLILIRRICSEQDNIFINYQKNHFNTFDD
jgi:hypothetical protein